MLKNAENIIKISQRMVQLASIHAEDRNYIEAIFVLQKTEQDLNGINDDENLGNHGEQVTLLKAKIQERINEYLRLGR